MNVSPYVNRAGGSKRLFENKNFKSPFSVEIANDVAEFGVDPAKYVFAAAYAGVIDGEDQYFIGRVPRHDCLKEKAADWSFRGKDDAWLEHPEAATPMINARFTDSNETNWKITGTYSVQWHALYVHRANG